MKKRSKRGSRNRIIIIAIIVLVVALLAVGGVVLAKSLTGLKSLTLSPDFAEQELDVNSDYTFTITADPASTKSNTLNYIVDNSSATFSASEEGKAVLHTTEEGTVTVSVSKKDVTSNALVFTVVDQAAKAQAEADAQAAEEAAAQAAADAEAAVSENAAPATELIMVTDTVKIRATPSTDGEVLELCKKGDSFTRYEETEDGWSKIDYNGTEAYIKSDYVVVATEEEIAAAKDEAAKEEAKAEEDKKETEKVTDTAVDTAAADKAAADKAAADKAAADATALAAAAAVSANTAPVVTTPAPAAPVGGTVSYTDKNGATTTFTTAEWEYINNYWAYTGQAEYFVHKHTCAELHALYNATH